MSTESYQELKERIALEQSGKSVDEIKGYLKDSKHQILAELDNMPKVEHRWIDRGAVMSCEGAGHPNHRSFKMK